MSVKRDSTTPTKAIAPAKAAKTIKTAKALESTRPTPAPTSIKKIVKKRVKKRTKAQIEIIRERFLAHYPQAKTELCYTNLYELLVCVMLSAQCTDKRVNLVTPALFARFGSVQQLACAELDEIKELIKSISFFNNKAKHLQLMARQVLERFGGEIPTTQEQLKSLAGVGQKTANVVLLEYCNANLMAVDTHVFRVSHRLGLSTATTPEKTERDLQEAFVRDLSALHQAFVLFGRYTCKALKPECEGCFVREFCLAPHEPSPAK